MKPSDDRDAARSLPGGAPPDQVDTRVVEGQLGRPPRGAWRVAARCPSGRPLVIAVSPRLGDGSPFPTALWLTCPRLSGLVSDRESAGAAARWSAQLRSEPLLAKRALAADAEYRSLRASLSPGDDPCLTVGVAGQADPLAVKCLHARVAAALCGIEDPVGIGVLCELEDGGVAPECADPRCADRGGPDGAERGSTG
jgi:hypothetical protein